MDNWAWKSISFLMIGIILGATIGMSLFHPKSPILRIYYIAICSVAANFAWNEHQEEKQGAYFYLLFCGFGVVYNILKLLGNLGVIKF